MAKILVVGGAGYVGSSVCAWLVDQKHYVWVLDDLSAGHRSAVLGYGFTHARAGDRQALDELLAREKFDCCMHFAAKALVAESVEKPLEYHENNVVQTVALANALLDHGVRAFVFSSTCAVFGDVGDQRIVETLPKKPVNPYGQTKLDAERALEKLCRERGLKAIALRYFNAAGAEPGLRTGEDHSPESHLIPNVLGAALGDRAVRVFGTDYPTPDGTCIRDYVHVSDLARAHESAMLRMLRAPERGLFESFNLGSSNGMSVRQIISACEKVMGRPIRWEAAPRRAGDPPRLVADSALARRELGFTTESSTPEEIIRSAWEWERRKRAPGRAIFLDRDGTLNQDPGYISRPDQMTLLPGVGMALAALQQAGFKLVVVSNQSGVGRGLIKVEDIPRIHQHMSALLSDWGVEIDHFELCFHRPEDGCDCRKPKGKLIVDAARKLGVATRHSYMVGDRVSDLEAGRAAGVGKVALVRTGDGRKSEEALAPGAADFVGDDLASVVKWILADQELDREDAPA